MFTDIGVRVWSSADWVHEIVAAGVGVAELPVAGRACVSSSLEGQGRDPGVVGQGRFHHVLRAVFHRAIVPRCGIAERKTQHNRLTSRHTANADETQLSS